MIKTQMLEMKLKELQELAKEKGIKNISKLKKEQLIEKILAVPQTDISQEPPQETQARNEEIVYSDPVRRTNLMGGVLEVMADGYGFLRSDNYQSGENDVYVSQNQIRRFNLKTGDYIVGNTRMQHEGEKYQALLYVQTVNDDKVDVSIRRKAFDDLTPVYPTERIRLERSGKDLSMRMIDLISPIGKGQRGIIVAPPKAGKTTLLKSIANSIT
ncbi:MAG: Rho termination factor N-terminal domain-containing protein, partial [Clostridia bacterium]|nr:Rho termination factor N-terminal domain-containing protein [Clostridia bacterium]